jgi:hypothetical protein
MNAPVDALWLMTTPTLKWSDTRLISRTAFYKRSSISKN